MSASASGCHDDSKTQKAMNRSAIAIGGHEPSRAPMAAAAADRTQLERAGAAQPHVGDMPPRRDGKGEAEGPDRGDQPDLRRPEAAARQDDRDERVEDPERHAERQDDEAEGDHGPMD